MRRHFFSSFFYQREEKTRQETWVWKSFAVAKQVFGTAGAFLKADSKSKFFFSFLPETERITGELMKRSLPWTFWCSMRWQSHMKKRKMPGWRWCFSILNMMERQSELRIWHRQRKSNLLTVAVLNKCQSENAASLFKSIRGLGLTVSGGRSPFLWGWRDFFFSSYQSSFNPNQVTSLQTTLSRHNNQRTWKYVWICDRTPDFQNKAALRRHRSGQKQIR